MDLLQDLVDTGREASRPELAQARHLLALIHHDAGDLDASAQEAAACVGLYQDLVDAGQDEHRMHLALALHTHARALDLLDRRVEAIEPFDRSIAVLRGLCNDATTARASDTGTQHDLDETPDEELSAALHNAAVCRSALGDHEHALADISEAMQIQRELDVDGPVLAESLNNLADTLLDLGRDAEALPHALEAVDHASDDDDMRFVALTTFARAYGPRRPDDALAPLAEAVAVADGDPGRDAILSRQDRELRQALAGRGTT